MEFESRLKDPRAALAVDFEPGRGTLLVAFGGMRGMMGIPPFEFFEVTRGLGEINRIYVRDLRQMWYHRGLPEVAENIDQTADYLRRYTGHASTRRVVLTGNSGGGYAALLFGRLLEADEVHAFAPRTFINPLRRMMVRDFLSWRRSGALLFCREAQWKYFDLRQVLRGAGERTAFHVHFGLANRLDRWYAGRLAGMPGVHLHGYPERAHTMIGALKESGELRAIMARALAGACAWAAPV